MIALLDTNAVIWALDNDARLGSKARGLIENSSAGDLCIADITLLEISMLIHEGRIGAIGSEAALLSETASKFRILPVNASIAAKAFQLDLPDSDPFDRVITATACSHHLKLITKDANIIRSNAVETIW